MPQTLIEIAQHVANACGISKPTSIIGNSSETARQILAAAQDEGESLTRRPDTGWTELIREKVITTAIAGTTNAAIAFKLADTTASFLTDDISAGDAVANKDDGTSSTVVSVDSDAIITLSSDIFTPGQDYEIYKSKHPLPSDYKYLVDDTLWDRTNYWELRGPLTPVQWQTYKSSVLGDTATTRRRWRIHNLSGDGRSFFIDPTPTDAAELVYEYMSTGWCKSAGGDPQTEWKKDDDVLSLDSFLFRLGLKWRILNRLGLDYLEEKNEYEAEVEKAIGRDTGGDILSLTAPAPISLITTCNVPDTGFGS